MTDSHGWVAVKRELLHRLNIADKITRFSSQKGDTVYLEEDNDANLFVKAFKERFGHKPQFQTVQIKGRSAIYSYRSYEANPCQAPISL